jgi:hypothetical protein
MRSSDACRALQSHLSLSVDTSLAALVPERVMVPAVSHWSNTTSLRALSLNVETNTGAQVRRGKSTRINEESAPKSDQRDFGVLQKLEM